MVSPGSLRSHRKESPPKNIHNTGVRLIKKITFSKSGQQFLRHCTLYQSTDLKFEAKERKKKHTLKLPLLPAHYFPHHRCIKSRGELESGVLMYCRPGSLCHRGKYIANGSRAKICMDGVWGECSQIFASSIVCLFFLGSPRGLDFQTLHVIRSGGAGKESRVL